MLRLNLFRQFLSQQKSTNTRGQVDSDLQSMLDERVRMRQEIAKRTKENLPIEQSIKNFYDSIVKITLYMKQDCWKSQYMYLLLNYHKLAFRRVSDLVYLDRASYLLDLRKKEESERWPAVKVVVALEPKVILSGIEPIQQFFRANEYFREDFGRQSVQLKFLQQFINKEVLTYLDSLFWHPMLTYQYTFHTNISSYQDTNKDNTIFSIIGRNTAVLLPRIFRNISSIVKEPERYTGSKVKLEQALKQLGKSYFERQAFFGGDKPNKMDFYLMSQLRTRNGSHLFMKFLEKDVGGDFWRWWIRLSNLCRYEPERITTI